MGKALFKDFLKEITKTFNRFLSIFFIVLIGVAFFAGVKATAPDMKHTADQYYDEYNMMDLQVMSTLGLTQEDIDAIYTIDGVDKQICGGPHVKNTGDLGKFVIKKEESSSSGVRRIKAVLK